MPRHPDPTLATVKELYGRATHCAYPSCNEPLFREVPEISDVAPNSTISHICAASPEGPRFDPDMTPTENRAASNLLLLCKFHSGLVDTKVSAFTVSELKNWKSSQLEQGVGPTITDEQARELLHSSFMTEVTMQAEVINVGGQSGGGGGAIGAGAVGGPGGDRITLNLGGLGPGGGGGSVVAPGRTPPDAVRAKVGRGRVLGTDGGDSYIGEREETSLIAKGAAAAGSPYETRSTSGEFSISSMMICNSIEVRDGLLFVLGGGWQNLRLVNTAEDVRVPVLLVIEAGGVDAGHYSLHVSTQTPAGRECGRVSFPVVVDESGDILRIPQWVILQFRTDGFGPYTFITSSDTDRLASIVLSITRITDA